MITGLSKIVLGILIVCLVAAGLVLLLTGWWLPEAATSVRLLGLGWLLVCIATAFIRRRPFLQVASAWVWFFTAFWAWRIGVHKRSLEWFLYEDLFPLVTLACSNVLVLLWGWRTR